MSSLLRSSKLCPSPLPSPARDEGVSFTVEVVDFRAGSIWISSSLNTSKIFSKVPFVPGKLQYFLSGCHLWPGMFLSLPTS